MIVARILLVALIATLLINRLLNTLKTEKDNREYRKEFLYYIICSLAGIAMVTAGMYILDPTLLAFTQFQFPSFVYWIGNVLMLLGISLWLWSKNTLGNNWSPRIAIREDHTLITTGPYHWVRHPIYTSYIIQVIGICMATSNLALIIPCAAISSLTWNRASEEEETLTAKFGEAYKKYVKETGKLFPRIF